MARRNVTRGTPPRLARSRRPKAASAGEPGPKKRRARSDDPDTTLGQYFKEMSELDVMSAEEEMSAAVRIATRRVESWKAILAYAPYADAIVDVIAVEIEEDERPVAKLRQLRKTARAVRDRDTKANREAFASAVCAVADVVGYIDTDSLLSDKISADLDALLSGYRKVGTLDVRPPRKGSKPFRAYVLRIRQAAAALQAEKHAFVRKNLRLVVSIARRFNHGKLPLQDLIQEGNIGLMKAVDRFDHRKGFRFSTYGSWWIRHAISRAVADKGRAIRLPVHMLDAHHKLIKARRELETKTGRDPTTLELSDATGIAVAKIEKMDPVLLENPVSLDRQVGGGDDRKVSDFLQDDDSPAPGDQIEAQSMNEQVRQVIGELRPIEADILRKRFGLIDDRELTLKEIGQHYSLSRERIRQLQEQALTKLRRELERREAV